MNNNTFFIFGNYNRCYTLIGLFATINKNLKLFYINIYCIGTVYDNIIVFIYTHINIILHIYIIKKKGRPIAVYRISND